jgi:hypothetical protein
MKLTLLLTFQRRVDELLEAFVLEPSENLHEVFQQARRSIEVYFKLVTLKNFYIVNSF